VASKLIKSAGLATVGTLVQGLARFGYTIVVGRALGAETLGQVSGLIALSVFVSLFWPTGAGVAASRFLPRDASGQAGEAASLPFLVREFLLSVPFLAAGTVIGALLVVPDVAAALSAAALAIAFSAYAFTRGAALGQARFLRIAVTDAATSALSIALLLAVVLGDLSWATLLPLATGYAVFAWVCWPRGGRPTLLADREITKFIFFNSLAQLATGGALQVAMVAAKVYDTPANAGLFAAAFSLATPASMLALSINQVLIPHIARLHTVDHEDSHRSNRRMTLLATAGFGIIFAVLIALAPLLLELFYGPSFVAAAPFMQWLLAGVYVYSVSLVPAASLIATGRDRRYAAAAAIGFSITVVTIVSFGSLLGAWAAVIGYVSGTLVSAALVIAMGMRRVRRTHTA
jgi:O-antigen/teichoic acid export membrane protein